MGIWWSTSAAGPSFLDFLDHSVGNTFNVSRGSNLNGYKRNRTWMKSLTQARGDVARHLPIHMQQPWPAQSGQEGWGGGHEERATLKASGRLCHWLPGLPERSRPCQQKAQVKVARLRMRRCAGRMGGRKTRTTVRKLPLKFQMRVLSGRLPVTADGHHQSVMRLDLKPMRSCNSLKLFLVGEHTAAWQ